MIPPIVSIQEQNKNYSLDARRDYQKEVERYERERPSQGLTHVATTIEVAITVSWFFLMIAPFFIHVPSWAKWVVMGGSFVLIIPTWKHQAKVAIAKGEHEKALKFVTVFDELNSQGNPSMHLVSPADLPARDPRIRTQRKAVYLQSTKSITDVMKKYDLVDSPGAKLLAARRTAQITPRRTAQMEADDIQLKAGDIELNFHGLRNRNIQGLMDLAPFHNATNRSLYNALLLCDEQHLNARLTEHINYLGFLKFVGEAPNSVLELLGAYVNEDNEDTEYLDFLKFVHAAPNSILKPLCTYMESGMENITASMELNKQLMGAIKKLAENEPNALFDKLQRYIAYLREKIAKTYFFKYENALDVIARNLLLSRGNLVALKNLREELWEINRNIEFHFNAYVQESAVLAPELEEFHIKQAHSPLQKHKIQDLAVRMRYLDDEVLKRQRYLHLIMIAVMLSFIFFQAFLKMDRWMDLMFEVGIIGFYFGHTAAREKVEAMRKKITVLQMEEYLIDHPELTNRLPPAAEQAVHQLRKERPLETYLGRDDHAHKYPYLQFSETISRVLVNETST